jgi:hypothetical protein
MYVLASDYGGSCITWKWNRSPQKYTDVGVNAHMEELVLWSLRKFMKEYILNLDFKSLRQHVLSKDSCHYYWPKYDNQWSAVMLC